ncbi:MAG: ATP-binding cassette domain-containing protein, partial [Tissierellia bacterium]|nr:ATP-binding cassette domain-containing protein [Tissierellia bacterium]
INYNIAFPFDEKIDASLIEQAAKTANVYDDIMDFPKGFDTILGERGVTLSGGQKQRVSIARALINETPILLIDDSLSAVDTETEDKILSNLKAREELATTIIISHRISTIKHSSEILFMDDGEIIERGTHEELIDLEGQYYSLYMKQLLEDKIKKDDYHGE